MKKVGIMSMQRICNYGSYLQAKALKITLQNLGCKVCFIDYHVEQPLVQGNEVTKEKKIFNLLKNKSSISHKIKYIKYKQHFQTTYLKNLQLSEEPYYDTSNLDVLIIGSDEVFNCIQSNNNVGYSLDLFGKNSNAKKKITYAASFGNTTISKIEKFEKTNELKQLINDFDSLSVRDKNSLDIVNFFGCNADLNIDPVLLYGYSNEIENSSFITKYDYLLVYAYSGRITESEAKVIKKFAISNKLKIVTLGGDQPCSDYFIDCKPEDIFGIFKNAKYVITDTFHGSIFSILTHSKFIPIVRKSENGIYGNEEKLSFLLSIFGLQNLIVNNLNEINFKEIDYLSVDTVLKNEREQSINYLQTALKEKE